MLGHSSKTDVLLWNLRMYWLFYIHWSPSLPLFLACSVPFLTWRLLYPPFSSPRLCLALLLSVSLLFSTLHSPPPSAFQKNELLLGLSFGPGQKIHFCGSSVSNCHFWQEPSHTITTWRDLDLNCFSFFFSLLSPPLLRPSLLSSYAC